MRIRTVTELEKAMNAFVATTANAARDNQSACIGLCKAVRNNPHTITLVNGKSWEKK